MAAPAAAFRAFGINSRTMRWRRSAHPTGRGLELNKVRTASISPWSIAFPLQPNGAWSSPDAPRNKAVHRLIAAAMITQCEHDYEA
jgi:hypothetical protein